MNEGANSVCMRGSSRRRRAHYSEASARRIMHAYADLQTLDDVVTISGLAKRTGESRDTVRAVLHCECGWSRALSRRAQDEGIRRGRLLLAVAGHPGLAKGRATMRRQGWPTLRRAQRAFEAAGYPGLRQGRATQASKGWPNLRAGHTTQAASGYANLRRGRTNLAVRGYPNVKRAQAVLAAQDYFPLLQARRRRSQHGPLPPNDRRALRSRSTRLAIVETLRVLHSRVPAGAGGSHVTAVAVAAYLDLHRNTVSKHLQQLRALGIIDQDNRLLPADRHES